MGKREPTLREDTRILWPTECKRRHARFAFRPLRPLRRDDDLGLRHNLNLRRRCRRRGWRIEQKVGPEDWQEDNRGDDSFIRSGVLAIEAQWRSATASGRPNSDCRGPGICCTPVDPAQTPSGTAEAQTPPQCPSTRFLAAKRPARAVKPQLRTDGIVVWELGRRGPFAHPNGDAEIPPIRLGQRRGEAGHEHAIDRRLSRAQTVAFVHLYAKRSSRVRGRLGASREIVSPCALRRRRRRRAAARPPRLAHARPRAHANTTPSAGPSSSSSSAPAAQDGASAPQARRRRCDLSNPHVKRASTPPRCFTRPWASSTRPASPRAPPRPSMATVQLPLATLKRWRKHAARANKSIAVHAREAFGAKPASVELRCSASRRATRWTATRTLRSSWIAFASSARCGASTRWRWTRATTLRARLRPHPHPRPHRVHNERRHRHRDRQRAARRGGARAMFDWRPQPARHAESAYLNAYPELRSPLTSLPRPLRSRRRARRRANSGPGGPPGHGHGQAPTASAQ